MDNAHSFHIFNKFVGNGTSKKIFQYLVLPYTESGFFNGHFRQPLCIGRTGLGNGFNDTVDPVLVKCAKILPGLFFALRIKSLTS